VELQVSSRKMKGYKQPYPIKLLYTANIPIILLTCFLSNLFFFSQVLYSRFKGNFLIGLLGKWQEHDTYGHLTPVGGLAYYLSPPKDFFSLFRDPFHSLFYTVFVLLACAFFAKIWIDVSGSSARDITRQLTEQDMIIEGMREESMIRHLNRYIPTAAIFGGIVIGALSIVADFMGAIGSGTGLVLAVTIIYQYFEIVAREKERGGESMIF
jgi:protein transport protein SEC61 subunit alpha